MYLIQLRWLNAWVAMPGIYKTRDDAEWALAQWKQEIACMTDRPFRVVDQSKYPPRDNGQRPPIRQSEPTHASDRAELVIDPADVDVPTN